MKLAELKFSVSSFIESSRGKTVVRTLRYLVTLGVIAYLGFKLTRIGWGNVWQAMPRTPFFYLIFLWLYLTPPVFETAVYRLILSIGFREGLRAFLRKRVYNEEIVGYSGEFYLYLWIKRLSGVSERDAFRAVRDNNVISALASTSFAFSLVAIFYFTGQLKELLSLFENLTPIHVIVGAVVFVALALMSLRFKRHLFSLSGKLILAALGIYTLRLLMINTLLIVQWSIVVPSISISVWFTYLAVRVILNRIPFLPSKDLFFLGLGVGMSEMLHVAEADIAGLLLASSVLTHAGHFLVLIATQRFDRSGEVTSDVFVR